MSHPDIFGEQGGYAVIETLAGLALVVALVVFVWFKWLPSRWR